MDEKDELRRSHEEGDADGLGAARGLYHGCLIVILLYVLLAMGVIIWGMAAGS